MSTDYTGNPTASAHSPSPAPSSGDPIVIRIPGSSDPPDPSSYVQAFQSTADYLAYLQSVQNRRIWHDDMLYVGTGLTTELPWYDLTSTVDAYDDAAAGASGSLRLDEGSILGVEGCFSFGASGDGDFTFVARTRYSGTPSPPTAHTMSVGIVNGDESLGLLFYYAHASHSTRWRTMIDGVNTAGNGTNVDIATSYQSLTITRSSNVVTFKVDGVTIHTIASYTGNLNSSRPKFATTSPAAPPNHIYLHVDYGSMFTVAL